MNCCTPRSTASANTSNTAANPFTTAAFAGSLDEVFGALMQPTFARSSARDSAPMTVWQDASTINIELDLPGVKMDNVDITMQRDVLTIKASRGMSMPEGAEVLRHESRPDDIQRVMRIAETIDTDRISAKLDAGVLKISLPKKAEAQPRKINVVSAN